MLSKTVKNNDGRNDQDEVNLIPASGTHGLSFLCKELNMKRLKNNQTLSLWQAFTNPPRNS
jgi:hypothetical protein